MGAGWIGVDLDGTLAHYEGWGDGSIGPPIPAMAERVKEWLAAGDFNVKIMTARFDNGPEAIVAIQDWCEEHLGARLEVTASKDFHMIALWDDRAVTVEANTGRLAADTHAEYRGPA